MTNKQTRTLADYPVGSRWRTEEGGEVMILRHDPTGNNWPLLSIDLKTMGVAGSFVDGLDWTRVDEPAPNGLREAAPLIEAIAEWERENGTVAGLMRHEYVSFCEAIRDAALKGGSARAALAQPAPASEPVAFNERRDRFAAAALTACLQTEATVVIAARRAVEAADALIAAMEPSK